MSNPFAGSSTQGVSNPDKAKSPWLDAWFEPLTGLDTNEDCILTCDAQGDGDFKLLVGTGENKPCIKVYRNVKQIMEVPLPDEPTSMASFYQDKRLLKDSSKTMVPVVAVACSNAIYFYRNLKPLSKLMISPADVPAQDAALWAQLNECPEVTPDLVDSLYTMLSSARDDGFELSTRSRIFLDITPRAVGDLIPSLRARDQIAAKVREIRLAYVQRALTLPHTEQTAVTALGVLPITADDPKAGGILAVGTEHSLLLLLNPQFTAVTHTIALPAAPVKILSQGGFSKSYTLHVACRDGAVYSVSPRASGEGFSVGLALRVGGRYADVALVDKQLVVATTDREIRWLTSAYATKSTTRALEQPTSLLSADLDKVHGLRCLLVALQDGKIQLYHGHTLLDTVQLHDRPVAMYFGCYGREDAVLVVVCADGSLYIKILQRTANLRERSAAATAMRLPWQSQVPLRLPTKSHLFAQQVAHERIHAKHMHELYQRHLCRLRLLTARTHLEALQGGLSGQPTGGKHQLRMSVSVSGLEQLLLHVEITNTGSRPVHRLVLSAIADARRMHVAPGLIRIAAMLPGATHVYKLHVDPLRVKTSYAARMQQAAAANNAAKGASAADTQPEAESQPQHELKSLTEEPNVRLLLYSSAAGSAGDAPLLTALAVLPPFAETGE